MAMRRPAIRLKSVLFPTFGRPTMASMSCVLCIDRLVDGHHSGVEGNSPDGSTMNLNWVIQGLKMGTVTLTELPIIMSGAVPIMVAIYSGIESSGPFGALVGGV